MTNKYQEWLPEPIPSVLATQALMEEQKDTSPLKLLSNKKSNLENGFENITTE